MIKDFGRDSAAAIGHTEFCQTWIDTHYDELERIPVLKVVEGEDDERRT